LFKVFNHLLNLPAFGVIFDDIEGGEMEIRGDKITGLLSFLFDHHNCNLTKVLDETDKSADLKSSMFTIEGKGDLTIGSVDGRETRNFGSFSIYEEDRIGPKLRNHMVTILSTKLSQWLSPIPTVCEKIDFTGDRETKGLKHSFDLGDFGLEMAAPFASFGVIEFSPEGQKEVLIKESKEDPLMAKGMGPVSPVFMPGTTRHLLARLLCNGVIHDKEQNRMLLDSQGVKELL
jgi:hypothetical protein